MSKTDILTREFLFREYVQRQRSAIQIGLETGLNYNTIYNYLRRYSIERRSLSEAHRRVYPRPENIEGFYDPSSEWHAYGLGFLAADGGIHRNRLFIKVKRQDEYLLANFREGLNLANPIKSGISNGGHPFAMIELHDSELVKVLARWGIVQNKTLSLTFPSLPPRFVPAFIRGYFDGDGTIYTRQRKGWEPEYQCRFISGSPEFLEALKATLEANNIGCRRIYRNQQSNAFVLAVKSKKDNLRCFARFIYTGASVTLDRKRDIFLTLAPWEV